jgi:hypothetical protein
LLGTLPVHFNVLHHIVMARFVDQIHLPERQCIVPPQWLGAYLRMCPKILQGHIVRVHLGLVQPQLVLSHLQAMYYSEDSFLINWLSSLTTIELHALINNGHPTCINTPPMPKSLTPLCTSKGLSSFANLNTGGEDNLSRRSIWAQHHFFCPLVRPRHLFSSVRPIWVLFRPATSISPLFCRLFCFAARLFCFAASSHNTHMMKLVCVTLILVQCSGFYVQSIREWTNLL